MFALRRAGIILHRGDGDADPAVAGRMAALRGVSIFASR